MNKIDYREITDITDGFNLILMNYTDIYLVFVVLSKSTNILYKNKQDAISKYLKTKVRQIIQIDSEELNKLFSNRIYEVNNRFWFYIDGKEISEIVFDNISTLESI